MRRLLAHRDSRIYLTGQLFSLLGDSSLWLAMGIWVKTLTGSNTQAGLVFFFFTAPALLAPALGLLADRVRRRSLLIATNALMAVAVLALLTVHDRGQVWVIDLVMLCYGISAVIIDPAQSALLSTMVPEDLLPDANGALRTVQEAMRLVGPLAGAGIYVAVGAHVIAVADAITFVFPVICLLMLRVDEPAPQPEHGRWSDQLTAGIRHIWRTTDLRRVTIAGICTTAVFGFATTIVYAIAGTGLHRGPAFVGVLSAVQGAGAVAGGLSAATLVRRLGETRLVGLAMLVAAAGALLQIPPLLPVVMAGEVVLGTAVPCLVVGLITLMQRRTPPNIQGRVFAAAETLITTPQTLSIALGAVLIGVVGYRILLAMMAFSMVTASAYLLTRRKEAAAAPAGVTASCASE